MRGGASLPAAMAFLAVMSNLHLITVEARNESWFPFFILRELHVFDRHADIVRQTENTSRYLNQLAIINFSL